MVAAIVARELLISGLRQAAIERGVVIAARDLGKLKTWSQAIAAAVGGLAAAGAWSDRVAWWALLVALVLTWVSGLDYARAAPGAATRAQRDRLTLERPGVRVVLRQRLLDPAPATTGSGPARRARQRAAVARPRRGDSRVVRLIGGFVLRSVHAGQGVLAASPRSSESPAFDGIQRTAGAVHPVRVMSPPRGDETIRSVAAPINGGLLRCSSGTRR